MLSVSWATLGCALWAMLVVFAVADVTTDVATLADVTTMEDATTVSMEEIVVDTEEYSFSPYSVKTPPHFKTQDELELCGSNWTVEIMIATDLSGSQQGLITMIGESLFDLANSVKYTFPKSKIGLLSYSDKPWPPLGEPDHFCYRLDLELVEDTTRMFETFNEYKIKFFGDVEGSQLDALYYAADTDLVNWSAGAFDSDGNPVLRLVLMVATDPFHVNRDALFLYDKDYVEEYKTKYGKDPENPECLKKPYPTGDELRQQYQKAAIQPVFFMVAPPAIEDMYKSVLHEIAFGGAEIRTRMDFGGMSTDLHKMLPKLTCHLTETEEYRKATSTPAPAIPASSTAPPAPKPAATLDDSLDEDETSDFPTAAVSGAAAGLVAILLTAAAGGYYSYDRNQNGGSDGDAGESGANELAVGDEDEIMREESAPVTDHDFV